MSSITGSPLNTLRIAEATLHAVPVAGGVEIHVVTKDGTQAIIAAQELLEFASEAPGVSSGQPVEVHAAAMRLAQRQASLKVAAQEHKSK